ncbi:MAG: hypothetical protein CVV02_10725 [Firmicutes bacterium HGW-Firmicutes-7]|nr:MAG: hypothetical protein CVV02_10725 [Firmicutes bacterium HGW-Firmicutes-7]
MKKVGISVIMIALILVFTFNTGKGLGIFKDLKESDWFYENVVVLVGKGIIEGYTDGEFKPTIAMTTDQFIKTMVVALGHKLENGREYWAEPYIEKALDLGIVKNGDFTSYNNTITRAEMAMLTVRVVEMLEGVKTYTYVGSEEEKITSTISDYSSASASLKPYIIKAYELGTITGYPDGKFKPRDSLKRSEACTVIRRVIDEKMRDRFVFYGIEIIDNLDGHDPDLVDFVIRINVLSPLEAQYDKTKTFLLDAVGEKLTNEIMILVKTKTDFQDIIPSKFFEWKGDKKIEVASPGGYTDISISGW